ncbi:hypothetical protein MXB_414 [Myxobolus squamalis]|nr:hypothetical protein MXB_414 [Myxobolus squamalis]
MVFPYLEYRKSGNVTDIFSILPLQTHFDDERNQFRASLSEYQDYYLAIFVFHIINELARNQTANPVYEETTIENENSNRLAIIKTSSEKRFFRLDNDAFKQNEDLKNDELNTFISAKSKPLILPKKRVSSIFEVDSRQVIKEEKHGDLKIQYSDIKAATWELEFENAYVKLTRCLDLVKRSAEGKNRASVNKTIIETVTIVKMIAHLHHRCKYPAFKKAETITPLITMVKNLNALINYKGSEDEYERVTS